VGVWRAFWLWRDSPDRGIKTLSVIGLLLVSLFIEFGLSVSVMGINVFRSVFISFTVALLAFITVRHLRASTGAPGAAP
jgi:heme A synthase